MRAREQSAGPPSTERLGWVAARALGFVAVLVCCFWLAAFIGSFGFMADTLTYLHAGERLNAGHPLYALSAGDSIPLGMEPPFPTFPLFSPPLVAVLFRPLAALPGAAGAAVFWGAMLVLASIAVATVVVERPLFGSIGVIGLSLPIGMAMAVGNVDCATVAATVAVCWLATTEPAAGGWRSRDGIAGVSRDDLILGFIVGTLISIKLTPAVFAVWLLGMRRGRPLAVAAVVIAVLAAVTILGSYPSVFAEYVGVVREAGTVVPGFLSTAGLLTLVGVPSTVAVPLGYAVLAGLLCAVVVLARRGLASLALALASLAMIVGSPNAQTATAVLALGMLSPYAVDRIRSRRRPAFGA
jgi:hypothetical protein